MHINHIHEFKILLFIKPFMNFCAKKHKKLVVNKCEPNIIIILEKNLLTNKSYTKGHV